MPRGATSDVADLWAGLEPDAARRLAAAALETFAARGFHAATTREIGQRAGMSPAAVYVHFRSKAELLGQISVVGHVDVRTVVEASDDPDGDPVERARAFVEAFARWHAERHTLARVIQYEIDALLPDDRRRVASERRRIEQAFGGIVQAGVDAGRFDVPDLSRTGLAALSLCIDVARWYEPARDGDPDRLAVLYGDLVLRMLGASA